VGVVLLYFFNFHPFLCTDEAGNAIVAKTGLGSSAALTTSLVGALLHWFGVVQLPTYSESATTDTTSAFSIVHNLAQLVHANAQGKIGSGFDVSSAVYGEFFIIFPIHFSSHFNTYCTNRNSCLHSLCSKTIRKLFGRARSWCIITRKSREIL
jgi:phosphomevalonate kinase